MDPLEEKKMAKMVITKTLESLFIDGELTLKDFDDHSKIRKFLKKLSCDKVYFEVVVDHRISLLEEARKNWNRENYDIARILFLTYFEHSINFVIHTKSTQKEWEGKTKISLLKDVSFGGKYTWLLEILELPAFSVSHLKTIMSLYGERNSFIHYKFKPVPDNPKENKKKIILELKMINKAVTYFEKYLSNILFQGQKGKLIQAINNFLS